MKVALIVLGILGGLFGGINIIVAVLERQDVTVFIAGIVLLLWGFLSVYYPLKRNK